MDAWAKLTCLFSDFIVHWLITGRSPPLLWVCDSQHVSIVAQSCFPLSIGLSYGGRISVDNIAPHTAKMASTPMLSSKRTDAQSLLLCTSHGNDILIRLFCVLKKESAAAHTEKKTAVANDTINENCRSIRTETASPVFMAFSKIVS